MAAAMLLMFQLMLKVLRMPKLRGTHPMARCVSNTIQNCAMSLHTTS
jgi:hypothetical protein